MADLLRVRAVSANGHGSTVKWEFCDDAMAGWAVAVDPQPTMQIHEGDIWQVELVDRSQKAKTRPGTATVRLIAKLQELKSWQKITALPDFWIEAADLQCLLAWLHAGTDVILIGHKGTGKTTFAYAIAAALGWEEPCKVDVYTIKRTTDLFGTDAAKDGSTFFVKSGLLEYIDRAIVSLREGLDAQFIVVLDEVNRVHAKVNESLHGLFDDSRQVTITTSTGSRTIKLPPNLHTLGTMNLGGEYLGTHGLDMALKDRFQPFRMKPMPRDYEVAKLVRDAHIPEADAGRIVDLARCLRDAAAGGQINFAPSYRGCRNVARLVAAGIPMKVACVKGFLGWYEGSVEIQRDGRIAVQPNSEVAKALAALRMRGIVEAQDVAAEVLAATPTGSK
jgi:energy-coupling factor transporter ATP-binding protein EcfA2